MNRTSHAGFTLIELVVAIVILGILAAVAVPRFSDLSASAKTAVAQGACGALLSSAVLLYASNSGVGSTGLQIIGNTTLSVSAGAFNGGPGCNRSFTPTGGALTACAVIPAPLCTG
jgi:prepilin-type N-terminal cleavage/methylation domain-containing protein